MKCLLRVALAGAPLLCPSLLADQIVFSEVMYNPLPGKPEFIEVRNITMTPQDMAKWHFTEGVSYTFPDFDAGSPSAFILRPQERVVVTSVTEAAFRTAYPSVPPSTRVFGPWTGALDNAGELVTLADKNGVPVATLKYGVDGRWPISPDGTGHSLVLVDEDERIDDFRNWRASTFNGGTPGNAEIASAEEAVGNAEIDLSQGLAYVNYDDTWKWFVPLSDPGTTWRDSAFDDSAWSSGAGILGFYNAGTVYPPPGLQTTLPKFVDGVSGAQNMGFLFRKTFTFSGNPAAATFTLDQMIDDGVVYYLNGQRIGAVGVAEPIAWNGAANRTVGTAAEEVAAVTGTLPMLVNGTNVLAAEVHQVSGTSSDIAFAVRLRISQPASGALTINEVKPGAAGQGFIEFHNPGGSAVDLAGYYLSDSAGNLTKHQIAGPLSVPAGGLATVGFAESGFTPSATTTVYLTKPDGVTPQAAIQAAIPLDGRSLGRKPVGAASWFLFFTPTPGAPNSSAIPGEGALSLNEVHFTPDNHIDWVEVRNGAAGSVDVSSLFLATTKDFADKVPLSGSIPANGRASRDTDFDAGADGEISLYLVDSNHNVLAAAALARGAGRATLQSWPENGTEWYATATATRDALNVPDVTTDVVITEIMFDPPSDHRDGEFVELLNRGAQDVSLAGWKLRGEADFDFPPSATIPAGGRVVVGGNAAWLASTYGISALGNWSGRLANKGGLLRLVDAAGNLADTVDYKVGGDWPERTAGLGSSLELIHPDMDNSRASAWRDSDESAKATTQSYSFTDTYRAFRTNGAASDFQEMHFWLAGDGEVVLSNVQVRKNGTGVNLLQHPERMAANNPSGNPSSADGWLARGTHHQTYVDGSGNLHIISEGHGDPRRNMAEIDISPLATNDSLTVSFDARWVWGKSRLVVQTFDQSVGSTFLLPLPNALGTPGAANSRASAAPLPQVDSVMHSPAVPKPGQVVTVTARVASATALTQVRLFHRLDNVSTDPATAVNWANKPMFDDGTNGDAVPNDGIFSARLTEYATNGQIGMFYVRADNAAGNTVLPKKAPADPALFIVDSQTVAGDLRSQRIVVSEYWRDALRSDINGTVGGPSAKYNHKFPRIQNHYFPATYIANESKVIYNVGYRKGGSPWTRPDDNSFTGGLSRGTLSFPDDRRFRNDTKRGFDNDAPGSSIHNRVVRYWMYLLGQPRNENEFVRVIINNAAPALREDFEADNNDLLNRNWDNGSSGQFYAVEDGWWLRDFDDQNRVYQDADWVYNQTTKNSDAPTRWHNEYSVRTRENEYDYAALSSMIKMITDNNFTESQLDAVLDIESVAAYQAVRGYIYDWDSFLMNRGKNCFLYRPPNGGKFMFLHWDSDLAFQDTGNIVLGTGRNIRNVMDKPYVRKKFIYYLTELVNKYTHNGTALSPRFNAWLDAEEDASTAFTIGKSTYVAWCTNRRSRVLTEINTNIAGGQNALTAPFALTSPPATTAADTAQLTGTAPSAAYVVTIDGHPEATFSWTSATAFALTGIQLTQGANQLTLRMFDRDGVPVGNPVTHTITKTGNAAPVVVLSASPASFNVALGQSLLLDATGSTDPENAGPLDFAWSISPTTGVTSQAGSPSARTWLFSRPGIYTITLVVTDADAQSTTVTRKAAVYSSADFDSFIGPGLNPQLTVSGTELRDSWSPAGWYSVEDSPDFLQVQVLDDAPHTLESGDHPLIHRPLPATGDWAAQTDVGFETRTLGTFSAGLWVETEENGQLVRYAFGPEDRQTLALRRSVNGGTFTLLSSGSNPVPVRINCGGPDVTESGSIAWMADAHFLSGTTGSQTYIGTANANVNDTFRADATAISYAVPLANGVYNVTCHSATSAGFFFATVTANASSGSWTVGNGLTTDRNITLSNVTVSNGVMNIAITRTAGSSNPNVILTGLQIIPTSTGVADTPFTALRVQRTGSQLAFTWQAEAGVWSEPSMLTLPAGTTAVRAGTFVATRAAQSVRMHFDYFMVVDPTIANDVLENLRITEVMYNPADDGPEFIEFQNIGDSPLQLSGVSFVDGQPFGQFTFVPTTLGAGEYIVLTENEAAFRAKYGAAPRLGGVWSTGSLNNAGERVRYRDANANDVLDFTYSDQPPWPTAADGQGPSLEIIDPRGDYNDGTNWRASALAGGTPGFPPGDPDADSDGDGISDATEALFGTDPQDATSRVVLGAVMTGTSAELTWPSVNGRSYRVQGTDDLATWTTLETVVATGASAAWSDAQGATRGAHFFYRVVAVP